MNAPHNPPGILRDRLPDRHATHEVSNQGLPATDFNAFECDRVLRAAIEREAPWARVRCAALGRLVGNEEIQEHARLANRLTPEARTHDCLGHRVDWVDCHPSWHALMRTAWSHEVHALAWNGHGPRGHVARAALSCLWNQIEQGTGCATGMAYAAFAGFEREPALAIWADRVRGTRYSADRREVGDKGAAVVGYALAEKQAGSDLARLQTTARESHTADYHGAPAHWYELTGHKWFCSLPQADGFFTLARAEAGLTCFFLPRTLPDGGFNRFFLQRLKDKCGNRSNATAEVEFSGTWAIRVGEEGRGLHEVLSQVHLLRLDLAMASVGLMRQALTLALRQATTRRAFGTTLAERPVMKAVLADLAVEVEAATLMGLRVARATDLLESSEHERQLARLATPAAKYFNCSRAPAVVFETLQCLGGNGYVEEHPMARLFRESPVNSVWGGSANMMCLDVRRVIAGGGRAIEALFDEVTPLLGQDARFDALVQACERSIRLARHDEFHARALTEAVARTLQAAELLRHSPTEVADLFLDTRAAGQIGAWGSQFGSPGHLDGAGGVQPAQAEIILRRAVVV